MHPPTVPRAAWIGAALVGGCTLFVETGDLQIGEATSGSTTVASSSSSGVGGGDPPSSSTSSGDPTGSGGGGASEGGGGANEGGGQGGGEGGGASWCAENAPPDAFLCADFDTPTTGLTNPPWSNEAFENDYGSITLDTSEASSEPASARVELVDVSIPGCGFQALERHLAGAPERLRVRFDVRGDIVGSDNLLALVEWRTIDDVDCGLILGLGNNQGSVQEQQFALTSGYDTFALATSALSGWHTVEWSIDLAEGFLEIEIDGRPMIFDDEEGVAMDLSFECSLAPALSSVRVRLGPHCEEPPLVVSFDDVVLAPW